MAHKAMPQTLQTDIFIEETKSQVCQCLTSADRATWETSSWDAHSEC